MNLRVYYVDGVPAQASARYRVFNALEQLRMAGVAGTLLPQDYDPDRVLSGQPSGPSVLVIHRAPWDERLAALIDAARGQGMRVLYDIDDLVFEPIALPWVRALSRLSEAELDLYEDGLRRYFRALRSCDGVLTTTRALAAYAAAEGVPAFVHRNGLDQRSLDTARAARQARQRREETVLYYGAGTATHDVDFQACGPAIERLMHKYSSLHLVAQGDVHLGYGLDAFDNRVSRWPWMPWPDYFWGIAQADINVAPLELGNPFCEVKSELKWFEAALMGIPTIASASEAFAEVIRPEENGFLAKTQTDWYNTLEDLINTPEKRRAVGAKAESDVLARYSPEAMGSQLVDVLTRVASADDLTKLAQEMGERAAVPIRGPAVQTQDARSNGSPADSPKLSIGWLATAPVRGGGGSRMILSLARYLHSFGHDVTVYVEPFEFFQSQKELESFIATNFPGENVPIVMGLDNIKPADAHIATFWLTAERLRDVPGRGKFYFVQDFEPFFYPMGEEYLRAEATYRSGFHHITIGRWCTKHLREQYEARSDYFDFPLDRTIYYPRPVAEDTPRPRVLFFSRPELPRRCYNIGIQALARLHRRMPEVLVTLFGSDEVDSKSVPFPCEVLKNIPDRNRLAELYSSADVALITSSTNTSLVPFELAACGCPVVELDLEVNRVNYLGSDAMHLAPADPQALADALFEVLNDADLHQKHKEAGLRLAEMLPNEEQAARRVEQILLAGLGMAPAPADQPAVAVEVNGSQGQLDGVALDVTCRQEDGVMGELQPGKEIAQTFRCTQANLAAIAVKTALYGRANACSLELSLYREGVAAPLHSMRQSVQDANDNGWVVFRFSPVADSAGGDYRFVISSPDAGPGNACGLYHARESTYREGKLQTNGRAGKGALVFQTFVQRLDAEEIRRLIRPERAYKSASDRNDDTKPGQARSTIGPNVSPQLREELQSLRKRLQQMEQRQADVSRRVSDLHNFLNAMRHTFFYRAARKVARLLRVAPR
jgi:glycosyltransferase involved in cell wall biosynthesis